MENNELKPCPFCGGKAEIVFRGRNVGYYDDDHVKGYIVARCRICKASSKGSFYEGKSLKNLPWPLEDTVGGEEAAYAWNRRID